MPKNYNYHKPSPEGLEKIQGLREAYSALHDLIETLAPHSRERAVALTELETSAMWSIKSIIVNDPESVVEEPQAEGETIKSDDENDSKGSAS